ncbi:glycosyltransferase family 2 protein [Permianibacter sp. IMCC34836]|uniref:glycosyltransferase family 2 protein n=1 Tax=Permianibacter fluminis TaxID=2738515 RepID=UPI001557D218|nr:glycosyltransferase family 2 protein [Permianibacter fluminis]NQD35548.1 glycosyltransferase family 2 protein [Permianibacter fluminis]
MTTRPAFLIPNFNHGGALPATVAGLRRFGLPILIVDDGSDAADQQVLDQLQHQPDIHIERLPVNRGKGAASMHGFRWLQRNGYSHAFQIDADGQHDQAVVPQFLAACAAAPTALIAGKPVYDASIPKARLYGRKITDFWVAIETLSLAIEDAMCGFRIYPLASTCALIDRVGIGERMDFDIEILVRLYWDDVPLQFLPLAVTYPLDGVSHFKALRDNLMISRMHAGLFFAMLPRAPLLLRRRLRRVFSTPRARAVSAQVSATEPSHWSAKPERGSTAGIAFLVSCYRLFGRRFFSALLYPVMLYFVLAGGSARRASQQFLQRAHAAGSPALPTPPTWRDSWRHFRCFGEAMLDKIAAWRGELDAHDVRFEQQAELLQLRASGRGALLIGSHLGNLELARALSTRQDGLVVNAVVFTEHGQRFMDYLKQQHPDVAAHLIEVRDMSADTAMLLRQRIDRGELLVIVGDRTPVHSQGRVQMQPFLGAPAAFAQGPFILASLLDCPVYLFFCLRQGKQFELILEPFATTLAGPRSARAQMLQDAVARYAERLAFYARQAPLQWFNFFDFWQRPEAEYSSRSAIHDSSN